jgi:hypothetical protein
MAAGAIQTTAPFYLAIVVVLSGGIVAFSGPQDNPPPFIELDVVVTQHDGGPVRGLTRGDVEVREDGRRVELQTITERQNPDHTADEGRTVILMLDDTGLAAPSRERVREIARTVLTYANDRDHVSVVRLSTRQDDPFGNLQQARDRVNAYREGVVPFDRRSGSLEALRLAARVSRAVGPSTRRRKALVCIGAAAVCNVQVDLWSGLGAQARWWTTAVAEASDANLAVYGIVPAISAEFQAPGIVETTGGRLFSRSTGLDAAIRQIWVDASHHYLLGYWGDNDSRKNHSIEVRVTKPRVHVLARRERGQSGT